jgi:hypothetical protein
VASLDNKPVEEVSFGRRVLAEGMSTGVRVKKRLTFVVAALVALVLAGSALAGGSLVTSYGGQAQKSLVRASTAQAKPAQAKASGALPFTGADIGVILASGAVLVLSGLALRRSARQKS